MLVTIFDKSFIHSITTDEAAVFDMHFASNLTPLFFVEVLADLEKANLDSPEARSRLVRTLAAKTPSFRSYPNVHHTTLVLGDLLGQRVAMTGVPVIAGGRRVQSSEGLGTVFDHPPEMQAAERWQDGKFGEKEYALASLWREQLRRAPEAFEQIPQQYDDGGLSGGTMDRPALKRLLGDVAARRVQIIVVYKVDRLTRSLADFAKIVDVLDAHGASFVSVTQQFNTTTSMGRLTLNMLLSFAQFEREIAGERIRDKIAASKAKGMWMGGNVPLGYDVRERKLIVNDAEAEAVRLIFRRYAELGSVRLLRQELDRLGVVSKRRAGAGGSLAGDTDFTRGALYTLLQNRLYRGEIAHQSKIYPGQQEAIVDLDLWDSVQARLERNRQVRTLGSAADEPSLLAGLVIDANGQRMTPTHATKAGRRYRYYVSAPLITGTRSDKARGWRIPAGDIEALVLDRLRAFLASEQELGEALFSVDREAAEIVEGMRSAARLVQEWPNMAPTKARELVLSLVDSIIVREEAVAISLKCGEGPAILLGGKRSQVSNAATGTFDLHIPAKLRRAGKGIKLALGGGIKKPDNKMITLLREAHSARDALLSGRDETIDAMAQRLRVRRDSLSTLIRLTYLAPDIVKALIEGQCSEGLTPNQLLQLSKDLPHDWQQQRQALGFLSQPHS